MPTCGHTRMTSCTFLHVCSLMLSFRLEMLEGLLLASLGDLSWRQCSQSSWWGMPFSRDVSCAHLLLGCVLSCIHLTSVLKSISAMMYSSKVFNESRSVNFYSLLTLYYIMDSWGYTSLSLWHFICSFCCMAHMLSCHSCAYILDVQCNSFNSTQFWKACIVIVLLFIVFSGQQNLG